MKTINLILVMVMLGGQISFGTERTNCCPDTANSRLLASELQGEMELTKRESDAIEIAVPSLQLMVTSKLLKTHALLDYIQKETENLPITPFTFLSVAVEKHLNIPAQQSVKNNR
jgi:hypothetical protein